MSDYHVYRTALPPHIREMITPDGEDDGYTVYIDEKLDDAQAMRAYHHAVSHVVRGDFEIGGSADQIENSAHK